MYSVMIDSYLTDNLSNLKCCASSWSNGVDISCPLDDWRQHRDSQVESLVYHLLQSVNVHVGDYSSEVILLATLRGSSTTIGPI
jgi:hypothetical protein